jgi:hypothetical protein
MLRTGTTNPDSDHRGDQAAAPGLNQAEVGLGGDQRGVRGGVGLCA